MQLILLFGVGWKNWRGTLVSCIFYNMINDLDDGAVSSKQQMHMVSVGNFLQFVVLLLFGFLTDWQIFYFEKALNLLT